MVRSADNPIELSIVVPVYGCADCLVPLHARVMEAAAQAVPADRIELILVDDCGPDNSWQVIEHLARKDPRVRGVRLSRNFGQHMAITAGLAQARGAWTMVMDCDLQDPPELIPAFYAKAREGSDIVLGRRITRNHGAFRKAAAAVYFRLLSSLSGEHINGAYGTFSILSRQVVQEFLKFQDRDRHYLFIVHWLGFRRSEIDYELSERFAGRSSYSLALLIRHAVDGLFFQTTRLLHWIVYTGLGIAALGFLAAFFFIYRYLVGTMLPGWTSLIVVLLIMSGITLVSIGGLGLFVARMFEQVKARPLFIVAENIGGEGEAG